MNMPFLFAFNSGPLESIQFPFCYIKWKSKILNWLDLTRWQSDQNHNWVTISTAALQAKGAVCFVHELCSPLFTSDSSTLSGHGRNRASGIAISHCHSSPARTDLIDDHFGRNLMIPLNIFKIFLIPIHRVQIAAAAATEK